MYPIEQKKENFELNQTHKLSTKHHKTVLKFFKR